MEVQSNNGYLNGNGVSNGNGVVPAKQFKSDICNTNDHGNRNQVTNFNPGPSKIDESVSFFS